MNDIVGIAGIDVSKDKLDVHVLPGSLAFTVSRDRRGLTELCRRLDKAGVTRVALEASGDYERSVIEGLEAEGFLVQLLNPTRVRRFAEATGILAKTDPVDARLIASYCQHFPDIGLTRRPEQARKLGEFLSVRTMLQSMIGEARNRLEHLREPDRRTLQGRSSGQPQAGRGRHCPGHRRGPGHGTQGQARPLPCRCRPGAHFNLAGPGPRTWQRRPTAGSASVWRGALGSKQWQEPATGKDRRRRDQIRPILHMVALAAIRANPIIKAFAHRLTAAGKSKLLVIAACARKIVVILNAMLRDQSQWQHAKHA